MTKSLASELAAERIRVNAVAPGYIETDMSRGGMANAEWFAIWSNMTPIARVGQPEEVAAAALFLCSPACQLCDRRSAGRRRWIYYALKSVALILKRRQTA